MHEISKKKARFKLSLKDRITIAKNFLLPQFTYLASVVDLDDKMYENINRCLCNFGNTGSTKTHSNKNWIEQDILYGPKSEGGLDFIDARTFFLALKISLLNRYATDKLDDHWMDIIDEKLKVRRSTRKPSLNMGNQSPN